MDQPGRGADQGPEAARPARRDARRLGRRVRPHADERSPQRLEIPRPRPPPALLHDLDGRRRHQARHSATATTDELGYYVAENKVHVHDLQATILHLLGFDAEQAQLPLPGAQPAPDRPRERVAGENGFVCLRPEGAPGVQRPPGCRDGGTSVSIRARGSPVTSGHRDRESRSGCGSGEAKRSVGWSLSTVFSGSTKTHSPRTFTRQ